MNYPSAMRIAKSGHHLRRPRWKPEVYLVYSTIACAYMRVIGDDTFDFNPTQSDIEADDWEMAK